MRRSCLTTVPLALLLLAVATATVADPPANTALEAAELDPRTGDPLPLRLTFQDDRGRQVSLADYFHGKPVILAPVWYSCPNLCSVILDGLVAGLRRVDFQPGRDFEVVAVSIDPRDGVEQAAALKTELLRRYDKPATAGGWHLLTGDEAAIRRLADRLGFGYRYDEASGQYAHPATLVLATADGRIARYLPGIEFPPADLRLALLDTAGGRLGGVVDNVLLRCFSYDPSTGRYTLAIVGLLRLLGGLTVAGIGIAVARALLRERRRGAQ